jgi:hypothetical protein
MPNSLLNEALLLRILRAAANGPQSYRPKDKRIPTLREFQLMVETAEQACDNGLIEASFKQPSKGKITQGLVRHFNVTGITRKGLQHLANGRRTGMGSEAALSRLKEIEQRREEGCGLGRFD